MKNTGIVRLVDELGRLVLPIELRRMLELQEGDAVEFFSDDERERILTRKYRTEECIFCKESEQLKYFKKRFVCSDCLRNIRVEAQKPEVQQAVQRSTKRQKDTLLRLSVAMEQNPSATQKDLALMIGVSQSRISQLIREMK